MSNITSSNGKAAIFNHPRRQVLLHDRTSYHIQHIQRKIAHASYHAPKIRESVLSLTTLTLPEAFPSPFLPSSVPSGLSTFRTRLTVVTFLG